jgi:Raf kinase inhibitor-like YbhB/YbcL family protein
MRKFCLLLLVFSLAFSADAAKKGGKKMLTLSSPAFNNQQFIPAKYTFQKIEFNPPLKIEGVPAKAKSLALIMDDPDAPMGTFVHWVVFNLPVDTKTIEEGKLPVGAQLGMNSLHQNSYVSPSPPPGKVHHYHFKLYALDQQLNLSAGIKKAELEKAMQGHIIEQATLTGLCKR